MMRGDSGGQQERIRKESKLDREFVNETKSASRLNGLRRL